MAGFLVFIFSSFRVIVGNKKYQPVISLSPEEIPVDYNPNYTYRHKRYQKRNINNIVQALHIGNLQYKEIQRYKENHNR